GACSRLRGRPAAAPARGAGRTGPGTITATMKQGIASGLSSTVRRSRAYSWLTSRQAEPMTSFDELLSNVPVAQIANQLGVDEATARTDVKYALPMLLGGLQDNASRTDGASAQLGELNKHDPSLVDDDGSVDIAKVDAVDGEKIVDKVF